MPESAVPFAFGRETEPAMGYTEAFRGTNLIPPHSYADRHCTSRSCSYIVSDLCPMLLHGRQCTHASAKLAVAEKYPFCMLSFLLLRCQFQAVRLAYKPRLPVQISPHVRLTQNLR